MSSASMITAPAESATATACDSVIRTPQFTQAYSMSEMK
jgi:hypothetical protein